MRLRHPNYLRMILDRIFPVRRKLSMDLISLCELEIILLGDPSYIFILKYLILSFS